MKKKEYTKPQTITLHIAVQGILTGSDEKGGYNGVPGGGITNQFGAREELLFDDEIWDEIKVPIEID